MNNIRKLKKIGFSIGLSVFAASAGAVTPDDGEYAVEFGLGGLASIAFDLGGSKQDIDADSIVGPDGATYIVGTVQDLNGDQRMTVTKLLPITGSVDLPGFGDDGKVLSPAGYHATSVALRGYMLYAGTRRTTARISPSAPSISPAPRCPSRARKRCA